MRRPLHAGGNQSRGVSLKMFSNDEVDAIHSATLEVLDKTGIFIEDDEALEILHGGGARVDKKTKVVRIPPHVVEDAIRSAPAKVVLAGRKPERDVVLEGNRVAFTNFGEGIKIVDMETNEIRETVKADVADSARIVDALDDVDVYERAMGAHDVPQEVQPLHNAEAFLTNTTKHCFHGAGNGRLMRAAIDIASAISGGIDKLRERPLISFNTCPVSPLKLVKDCCEIIMEGARSGFMVNVLSQALSGATAPVTTAGTLVIHNAEVLAGITLNQLTRRGAPVMYGSSTCPLDLKKSTATVGSPECGMISASVAQIAQFYQIPSWAAGG